MEKKQFFWTRIAQAKCKCAEKWFIFQTRIGQAYRKCAEKVVQGLDSDRAGISQVCRKSVSGFGLASRRHIASVEKQLLRFWTRIAQAYRKCAEKVVHTRTMIAQAYRKCAETVVHVFDSDRAGMSPNMNHFSCTLAICLHDPSPAKVVQIFLSPQGHRQ